MAGFVPLIGATATNRPVPETDVERSRMKAEERGAAVMDTLAITGIFGRNRIEQRSWQ